MSEMEDQIGSIMGNPEMMQQNIAIEAEKKQGR